MKEKDLTMLPIAIPTEYFHTPENKLQIAEQQIEKAGFYMETLFKSIEENARYWQANTDGELQKFCDDVIHLSQIGRGIATSIFPNITPIEEIVDDINENNRIVTEDESEKVEKTTEDFDAAILGNKLSAILNDESLPDGIYNSLIQAVDDIANDYGAKVLGKFERSPEYLTAIFSDAFKREKDDES